MGIYIKGMKLPGNCSDCPMCYDMMECTVAEPIINFFKVKEELEKFDFCTERHLRCPLVSVGPHGRLIDADALADVFRGFIAMYDSCPFSQLPQTDKARRDELQSALAEVINAPTIIPAEEGE